MYQTEILSNIIEKIKASKKSLVLSHLNPDGDTLGSMLALGAVLKESGHVVDHVVSDDVPEILKFSPFAECVKRPESEGLQKNYDLAFSLDCGSIKRLGSAKSLWVNAGITINIDHHVSNEGFGNINWIEPEATSTGQVVYWLTKELKVKITKEIATLFYITLLTDTGCFSNSNTNAEAMKWASELILLGAEHEKVYKKVFMERPYRAVKLFGAALNNLSLLEDGMLAWTYVDNGLMKSLSATSEDAEDIVDYMMRTKGVKVGVFFRDDLSEIKVSLRSNTNEVDVSRIAASVGGGGHKRAAGANIKAPFNEVKKTILDKVLYELKSKK